MSTRNLVVLLHGQVIGELIEHESGQGPHFTYAEDYVANGEIALSARLPIQRATFPPERVLPYLRGLVPENFEVRARWGREFGVSPADTLAILAHMGWDSPGAVQFCSPDQLHVFDSRSHDYVTLDDSAIAARLRGLSKVNASWTMSEEHWSLGGQQEKIALTNLGGQWLEAHGSAATTHILKPGIRSLAHQALMEHLTMRAASMLHIHVAQTTFQRFEDQWAIVIQRFDRRVNSDHTVQRIHQEDFTQALGRFPEFKYEDAQGPGLRDMARLLTQDSLSLHNDRLGLADFLIINAVAGAPDGHSKNIALLRTGGGSTIAPLFDLATGLGYQSRDVGRTLAISVGGERHVSRIYSKHWIKSANTLGINSDLFLNRVAVLARDFPTAFAHALSEMPNTDGIQEVADRTLPRITDNCQQILHRL